MPATRLRRLDAVDNVVVGFVSFDDVLAGMADEIAGLAAIPESGREREVEENPAEESFAETTLEG